MPRAMCGVTEGADHIAAKAKSSTAQDETIAVSVFKPKRRPRPNSDRPSFATVLALCKAGRDAAAPSRAWRRAARVASALGLGELIVRGFPTGTTSSGKGTTDVVVTEVEALREEFTRALVNGRPDARIVEPAGIGIDGVEALIDLPADHPLAPLTWSARA